MSTPLENREENIVNRSREGGGRGNRAHNGVRGGSNVFRRGGRLNQPSQQPEDGQRPTRGHRRPWNNNRGRGGPFASRPDGTDGVHGRIRGVGRGDTSRNPESESNTQTIEQAGLREKKNRRKRLSTNSLDDEIHDLPPRERIEKLLLADKYECAICLKRIRRNQLAFMCQQCYHIFHISRSQTATGNSGSGCLTEWAFTSYTAEGGWQCPHCKFQYYDVPTVYKCFCGKRVNPSQHGVNSSHVPHSCAEICGKARAPGCPHRCTEICHPGPCPGCPAMKVISCGCGREEKAIRCGTGVTFQCRERCGKSLNCGQHYCEETCHSGPCNQCESLIHRECYCGSENQILPCSAENLRLDENFSCGKPCTGMFSCGEHQCDKKCHEAVSENERCGVCTFDPERLTHCPCGKISVPELLETPRQKCTDPFPTCVNTCLKVLPCSVTDTGFISARCHRCDSVCHSGTCPPCKAESTVTCRCKALTKEIPCEEFCTYNSSNPFLCDRRCRKTLTCQKHKCHEKCCTQSDHTCLMICGKKLDCGLHSCDRLCHIGKCHRCLEASFEEQYCMCGRTVRMPPVPCGTPLPPCEYPCSRPHSCGHPQSHTCHSEAECPPCTFLTSKHCFGKHEIRNNVPCYQTHVSCGNPCNKPLPCGVHKCKRTCHAGECTAPGEVCRQPCSVPRKDQDCEHICGLPCHGTTPCKSSDCVKKLIIRCPCGRLTAESKCFDIECEHKRKRAAKLMDAADERGLIDQVESEITDEKYISLQCDSECKRLIRNRKIFEALELDKRQTEIYSEFLLEQVNRDDEFIRSVENIFTDIVSSAQRSRNVDKMSYVFSALSADRRKAIHDYAPHFKIETKSSGIGQQRNTTVTARYTSGFPNVYLTAFRGKKSCFDKQKDAMPAEDGQLKKLENSRPVVRRF
ncbi:hypothetical protein QR680_012971 [Steinernema hermaphroditum]|uniref:R3H domain-containing protein n=1 Tax=Steinernema hermaphroditum TaxID=289476 RepID=A0AA39I5J6_9BILA|nr:hypothetical protein QR680_012971 [Steinernema hermaphroditum]